MSSTGERAPLVGATIGSAGTAAAFTFILVTVPAIPATIVLALLAAISVAVVAAIAMGATVLYPLLSTRGMVRRDFGHQGFATRFRLYRGRASTAGRLRALGLSRRSVLATPPDQRYDIAQDHGTLIGSTAVGPLLPIRVWAPHEQVVLGVGPPRCGKTQWLCSKIIDHRGPVISTSTKTDVFLETSADRELQGPVLVFNPENLGGIESTFAWSPLTGCENPSVAEERASHLVAGAHPGEGVTNGDFFEAQATKVLKVFLLTAAVGGKTMADVARWVNKPRDSEVAETIDAAAELVPAGWMDELAQIRESKADRSTASIFMTLSLATGFMSNPTIAKACNPSPRQGTFDIGAFLACNGTLFIIGHHRKDNPIAPLITALTGYAFESSKRIAQDQGGKLAVPPLFGLDEVALITPVPLDEWNADAGGRNIHLIEMVQSMSQLFKRYGERGGQTIMNTAGVLMYWGGIKLDQDLEAISKLSDEIERTTVTVNSGGGEGQGRKSYAKQWRRVLTPALVRLLPMWHIIVVYSNIRVTIVSYTPVFKRTDTVAALTKKTQKRWHRGRGGLQRAWDDVAPPEAAA